VPLRIGISSCLLGERVRYDGDHKRASWLEALTPPVEWVPVCPEVEAGMGVPREPVRLVRAEGGPRMVSVNTGIDYTDAMHALADRRIAALAREGICGYVLKKDSPSCGLTSVKVFDGDALHRRDARGLFAGALVSRLPGLPVVEEDRLSDECERDEFLHRCAAYARVSGERTRVEGLGPYRRVPVIRVGRGDEQARADLAAAEEPLEVRLHGRPFAVIMRTPGSDRELAAGFLFSEGVIERGADIGAVEHCRHPDHPDVHNVVDVYLIGERAASVGAHLGDRRRVLTTSSCGVCGRTTIESLRVRAAPLRGGLSIPVPLAASLPERLRAHQSIFDETGGLHGAALFAADGSCAAAAEDVGRHNAVDKIVGTLLLRDALPLSAYALAVSGRASYEILQKAWLAGISLVCAVSAPSSLAVELAQEAGITLLGFARDGGFNLYTHGHRITR
jgi:FdhD protein